MGYKEDLKKINAALRDPRSRCYDPLAKTPKIDTQRRKEANQRKLRRKRCVMRWRRKNRIKYRAYMREYMVAWRAKKNGASPDSGAAALPIDVNVPTDCADPNLAEPCAIEAEAKGKVMVPTASDKTAERKRIEETRVAA